MKDLAKVLNSLKPNKQEMADVMFATVSSINPLKIKFEDGFILSEEFLILSPLCVELIYRIPFRENVRDSKNNHIHVVPEHTTEPAEGHTHTVLPFNVIENLPDMLMWRGLWVGDRVTVMRIFGGQKYMVMWRNTMQEGEQ